MNKALPDNPYDSARFVSLRVDPHFHKRLRSFAVEKDASVSAVVLAALSLYMDKFKAPAN